MQRALADAEGALKAAREIGHAATLRYALSYIHTSLVYADTTRTVDPCQIHCEANFSPWLPIPFRKRAEISRRSVHPLMTSKETDGR